MMSILLLIAFAYGLDTLGKNYPAYGWAIHLAWLIWG